MSRMVEQHVKVSIVPGGVPPRVSLKQYDVGLNSLKLHVYDNNNTPYIIANDTAVSFRGTKIVPGGTSYMLMYDCTFTSNIVSVSVPMQLTMEEGEIQSELVFVDANGNTTASVDIVLDVEKGIPSYGVTITGTDLAYANQVLTRLQQEAAYKEMLNTSPFTFKGTVTAQSNLPSTGNTVNDTYYVTGLGYSMSWNGSAWSRSSFNESDYTARLGAVETGLSAETTRATTAENLKVNKPIVHPNGKAGQVLRSNGDGNTEWMYVGNPTDEQVEDALSDWLDAHPEALKDCRYDAATGTLIM